LLLEFSQGLILPTKDSSAAPKTSVTSPNATGVKLNSTTPEAGKKAEANGASELAVKKLVLNEEFKCRVEELYNTFVDVNVSVEY
jgi:activator of HSP90 ATPase